MAHHYKLTLTSAEMDTLAWLADRGYDCGLFDALVQSDERLAADMYATDLRFEIPEHAMREVTDRLENDKEAAFACLDMDSEMGEKIQTLLNSVD